MSATNRPAFRLRRRWIIAAAGVLVAATVGIAIAVGNNPSVDTSRWCDDAGDIQRADPATDECTGVSAAPDFSYVYHPEDPGMRRIQELIGAENRRVTEAAATDPAEYYVDIAIVLPMPWHGKGLTALPSVTHQLQGAYARQHLANSNTSPGHQPRIRLLVTNSGYDSHAWKPVVERLRDLKDNGRLVAAMGLGPSLETTRLLLAELSKFGLATLGSIITADNFHGLLTADSRTPARRITPTNSEEMAAALGYMKTVADPGDEMVLVAAGNRDDHFTKTLIEAFERQFSASAELEFYDPDSPSYDETLDNIAARICNRPKADLVYFAGRDDPAMHLVAQIGRRCGDHRRVMVFTGDSVTKSLGAPPVHDDEWSTLRAALSSGRVELYYTALAHPGQWAGTSGLANAADLALLTTELGKIQQTGTPRLDDGQSIMAYDAVLVLGKVIGHVASGLGPDGPAIADLRLLDNGFLNITRTSPVCGASGPIVMVRNASEPPGGVGNTINKPIPIARITLTPAGDDLRSEFKQLYHSHGAAYWAGQCGRAAT